MKTEVGHGSTMWADEAGTSDPVGVLKHMLATYTLDPRFCTLGESSYRFHEQHDDGTGPYVKFWGNFYDVSCVFNVEVPIANVALIAELTSLIDANLASEQFVLATKDYLAKEDYWVKRTAEKDRARQEERLRRLRAEVAATEKALGAVSDA